MTTIDSTQESATSGDLRERSVADAREYLSLILPEPIEGGGIVLALRDRDGWRDLPPFSSGVREFRGATHEEFLDSIAEAIVSASGTADVFASPYPHRAHGRRESEGVERRLVHADIDGHPDIEAALALGTIIVASGSSDAEGKPHAHVYLRLSESVSHDQHRALCAALGESVGRGYADSSKTQASDVLRPPGTLNHKSTPPRPVTWITRPDDPAVRIWEPRALAKAMTVELPPDPPPPDPEGPVWWFVEDEPEEIAPPRPKARPAAPLGDIERRIDGLVRHVQAVPQGEGNGALNHAAGVAAALGVDRAEVEPRLIAAYATRPTTERPEKRRREAQATIASGWRWGAANPEQALRERDRVTVDEEREQTTDEEATVPQRNEKTESSREARLAEVRRTFPLADLGALVDPNRPPRRWFWDEVVPEGEHVSIFAPAGEGKSLLTLALSVAAARGASDFIGRGLTLAAEARVLYVDMENSEEDHAERLRDLGVTPANVAAIGQRLLMLSMPPLRGLDTEPGAQQLRDVLDAYGLGAGDVLVLDSTQRVTEGDENSNDTMRHMYNRSSAELKRRGVTVIRTDNTGHEGTRARGASAKRDDVGASWSLKPDETEPDVFSLIPTKRRAKGKGGAFSFRRGVDERGLLVFEPATNSYGRQAAEIRELLEHLGVPADAGVNKAYAAFREAKRAAADAGEPPPKWMTRKLVEKVQGERIVSIEVVSGDADDDPDGHLAEVVK